MAKIKATERDFGGQVISWIQEQLKEGGLPFENATNDSSLYKKLSGVKFPDVLLTLDFGGLRPFCGGELKTPKMEKMIYSRKTSIIVVELLWIWTIMLKVAKDYNAQWTDSILSFTRRSNDGTRIVIRGPQETNKEGMCKYSLWI
jgi:hypothetical protein